MEVVKNQNFQKGFTLIETVIYIAFFSVIIGGLLGITFQIIAATDQINRKIIVQQEANFILKKIEWALSGATSITEPAIVNPATTITGNALTVTKYNFTSNPIRFSVSGTDLQIATGAGLPLPLNSSNIQLSNFTVTHNLVGVKETVVIGFQIGGEHFEMTKYIRK